MQKMKVVLAAAVLGFLLLAPLCAAAEGLSLVQSFSSGASKLRMATFVEGPETVGLLVIATTGRPNVAYGFERDDWVRMRALVTQAAAAQSSDWLEVGSMTETETKSHSRLTISVNATTMRFIISDPATGTNDFLMPRADVAGFLQQSAGVTNILTQKSK